MYLAWGALTLRVLRVFFACTLRGARVLCVYFVCASHVLRVYFAWGGACFACASRVLRVYFVCTLLNSWAGCDWSPTLLSCSFVSRGLQLNRQAARACIQRLQTGVRRQYVGDVYGRKWCWVAQWGRNVKADMWALVMGHRREVMGEKWELGVGGGRLG